MKAFKSMSMGPTYCKQHQIKAFKSMSTGISYTNGPKAKLFLYVLSSY